MDRNFLEQLEAADNEAEVRERLAAGLYNARHAALAKEFLRRREEMRAAERSVIGVGATCPSEKSYTAPISLLTS